MKHYLIDSENVGDFWIPLLDLPAQDMELIVFYTKNSPHMSYDSLIKLKESDRTVIFIKCYEGTNALDFQLCSELGYRIALNEDDDFIIVTNDTGYDAAVKYWRHKEYSVKRIAGKDSRTGSRRRGNLGRYDVAAEVSALIQTQGKETGARNLRAVQPADEEALTEVTQEMPAEDMSLEEQEITAAGQDSPDMSQEDTDSYEEPAEDGEAGPEEEYDEYEDEPAQEEEAFFPAVTEEAETISDGEAQGGEDDADTTEQDEADADPEDQSEDAASEMEEQPEETAFEAEEQPEETSVETEEQSEDTASEIPSETAEQPEDTASVTEERIEDAVLETEEQAEAAAEPDALEEELSVFEPDMEEITAIVSCIAADNLAELHNQLIQFYGDDGKEIYQQIKSGSLSVERQDWDKQERFLYYSALIFRHSSEPKEEQTEENIREFAQFLLSAENKRKNLNSLRYALLKHYGKEKGRRYYFLIKPYVKAFNQM